jgi:uncharacterized protein
MPAQPNLHPRDLVAEVRAVYRDLDRQPVDRACQRRTGCCRFLLTGRTPFLTAGEALVAAQAVRATGRTRLPEPEDGACPLLHPDTGACLIYADRPFGCRTHFCDQAGGPYARRDVLHLIRRLEKVDAELGGDGSRPLPKAVAAALEKLGNGRSSKTR